MSKANDWPSTRHALLRRVRDLRNDDAWAMFVDLYSPLVYRFCRQRGLQDADARDVVQEVFIRVSRGIRRFDPAPEKGRFRAWLGTIIYREIQRQRVKSGQSARGVGGPDGDAVLEQVEAQFTKAWESEFDTEVYQYALERIRSEADPDAWTAFQAVWIEDRKPRDVAEQLNRPVDWVYKAKYKVLCRLKDQIQYLTAELPGLSVE